jgi:predicted ribosome quality control (RQC) complex YloA/Tae2 family protein
MSVSMVQLIVTAFVSIAGGGLLGTILSHHRLAPKSYAEAREITAAAIDKDWARFEREIGRLVQRCEDAEDTAKKAMIGQRECEEREIENARQWGSREIELTAKIAKFEAILSATGEARQRAAGILAMERTQEART